MYFKEFPKILYDFKKPDGSTETKIVRDITRNVRFRKEILENITVYDEYDIQDGETPEIIAEKVYGNPKYHWVIMLANQRWEYINDFPLDETSLIKYIEAKYPDYLLSRTYEAAVVFSNIVLKMGIGQTVFSDPKEQALRDWLNQTGYADLDSSSPTKRPNSTDARQWLLNWSTPDRNPLAETILKEFLAVENAAKGTFPSILFKPDAYTGIAYYEDAHGFRVDSDYAGALPITNEQHERRVNETKRRIKLISKDALNTILRNYRDLM